MGRGQKYTQLVLKDKYGGNKSIDSNSSDFEILTSDWRDFLDFSL